MSKSHVKLITIEVLANWSLLFNITVFVRRLLRMNTCQSGTRRYYPLDCNIRYFYLHTSSQKTNTIYILMRNVYACSDSKQCFEVDKFIRQHLILTGRFRKKNFKNFCFLNWQAYNVSKEVWNVLENYNNCMLN